MLIYLYWNDEIDTTFTDQDKEQVDKMCKDLDSKWYQDGNSLFRYETDEGPIAYWRDGDGTLHGQFFYTPHEYVPESSIANGMRGAERVFTGDEKRVTRETAIRKMKREHGKHALYGLSYGNTEELAADEIEIMVFHSSEDFYTKTEEIRKKYEECGISPVFLAVHDQN